MGWVIAVIVAFLLFGKNLTASLSSTVSNTIGNVYPNPNGLPASTTQNTDNTPANQPSPWSFNCPNGQQPGVPAPTSPKYSLFQSGYVVNTNQTNNRIARPVSRITFQQ